METSTILVVDDSKDFIFLLSSLLKFHKIKVDAVAEPLEAIELCRKNEYALIISDYLMEGMNGLELCQRIRKEGLNQSVPAILITAKDLESEELQTLSALSLTYVKKPVMPNELYRKINDILGRKRE
jgi:two-component system, OmpR family, alkaline phosphatase synthesis response regulator PhoP